MSSTLPRSRAAAVSRLSHGEGCPGTISADSVRTALWRFGHLNADGETVAQVFQVGDDQDLFELGLDGLNGLDDAIAAVLILRAEALVDDERLQPRAGAMGQQTRQRDANRKIDAKAFAAAEHLVAARPQLVRNLDVERFNRANARAHVALCLELDVHAPVRHPRQDAIGLFFDLGNGRLDDHGLNAAPTEGVRQVAVDALLAPQGILARQALALLALQERAVVQFALSKHALIACLVTGAMRLGSLEGQLAQALPLRGQRLRLRAQLTDALLVGRALLFEPLQVGCQLGDLRVEVL